MGRPRGGRGRGGHRPRKVAAPPRGRGRPGRARIRGPGSSKERVAAPPGARIRGPPFRAQEYSEDYDLDEDFSFVELFADAPTPPGKCGLCGHGSKDSVQKPSDCITCDDDSYIVYYVHGDGAFVARFFL